MSADEILWGLWVSTVVVMLIAASLELFIVTMSAIVALVIVSALAVGRMD